MQTNLAENVDKLEKELLAYKTSQAIGSSNAAIVRPFPVQLSSGMTTYGMAYFVVVFKGESPNPLICFDGEIRGNNTVLTPGGGEYTVFARELGSSIIYIYDRTLYNSIDFDSEYTKVIAFFLYGTYQQDSMEFVVNGRILASCNGQVIARIYDDNNSPPIPG